MFSLQSLPTSNSMTGWSGSLTARTPDTSLPPPPLLAQPLPATSLGSTDSLMTSLPFVKPFKQPQAPQAPTSMKFSQPPSIVQRPSLFQQQPQQPQQQQLQFQNGELPSRLFIISNFFIMTYSILPYILEILLNTYFMHLQLRTCCKR